MRATIIQLNSQSNKEENIKTALDLIKKAVKHDNPDIVVLPEMSICLSANPEIMHESAEPVDVKSPSLAKFSSLAKALGVYIYIGSLIEIHESHYYNTSVIIDKNGGIIGSYRKIHRFDIVLPNGEIIHESDIISGGRQVETFQMGELVFGCSICYDIRFAELYQQLRDKDCHVITIPSAFVFETGADHWETLIRARAIETQCYIIAPNQIGAFDDGKYNMWGHSMIVDPWGQVIAQMSNKVGWATAYLDMELVTNIRTKMPLCNQRVLSKL